MCPLAYAVVGEVCVCLGQLGWGLTLPVLIAATVCILTEFVS